MIDAYKRIVLFVFAYCIASSAAMLNQMTPEKIKVMTDQIKMSSFNTALNGCKKGSAFHCNQAIICYKNGDGVEKDDIKAKELYDQSLQRFQKECDINKANGCYQLGKLIGDLKSALPYYEISCDHHSLDACGEILDIFEWYRYTDYYPEEKLYYEKQCKEGKNSACVVVDGFEQQ